MDLCENCQGPPRPSVEDWKRRYPGYCRLRVCDECATDFKKEAQDRADSAEDHVRLAGVYASLAGEVWTVGETAYWFTSPIAARVTALRGETTEFRPNGRPPF